MSELQRQSGLLCLWKRCASPGPYGDQKLLFEHVNGTHNVNTDAQFSCLWDSCPVSKGISVAGPLNRAYHLINHTKYPFICKDLGCGRAFASNSAFKTHQATHAKPDDELALNQRLKRQRVESTEPEPPKKTAPRASSPDNVDFMEIYADPPPESNAFESAAPASSTPAEEEGAPASTESNITGIAEENRANEESKPIKQELHVKQEEKPDIKQEEGNQVSQDHAACRKRLRAAEKRITRLELALEALHKGTDAKVEDT